jgi:hypothetical protein
VAQRSHEFDFQIAVPIQICPFVLLSMADSVFVMVESSVDFPTEGNPIMATLASPDLRTSKPSHFSPFFPVGSSSSVRYLANFALRVPRW